MGASWEAHRLKDVALEDRAYAVVELRAGLLWIDVALLPTDDLGQVRFGQEAHRGVGPVVQVRGLGDELLACLVHEADVQCRADDRVAQLVGCQSLQRLVVHELVRIRHAVEAAGGVGQRNEPMGLTAAVGGVESEDRGHVAAGPGKPPAHVAQQVLEPPRGVGVGEESDRVAVLRAPRSGEQLGQIGREVGVGNPGENVLSGLAGLTGNATAPSTCLGGGEAS